MTSEHPLSRRKFASTLGGALAVALAGCSGGGGNGGGGETTAAQTTAQQTTEQTPTTTTTTSTVQADTVIEAGPNGSLTFVPERVKIQKGDTVKWVFKSSGHNVCGRPKDASQVELPEGAELFSSYAPSASPYTTEPAGTTYTHTFQTKGEYTYVCVPHAAAGMIGHITVA